MNHVSTVISPLFARSKDMADAYRLRVPYGGAAAGTVFFWSDELGAYESGDLVAWPAKIRGLLAAGVVRPCTALRAVA